MTSYFTLSINHNFKRKMFFKNKLPAHLPFAEGEFIPGALDVMTEYGKNGIFIRLYYPTDLNGKITDYTDKWIPWIAQDHYLRGLAKVVMIWLIILKLAFWFYSGGNISIPVVYGAKPRRNGKMKCIIMSHGLGATRYFYSAMCADLASRGFLVAVVEHRDESACSTYYFESEEDVRNGNQKLIEYRRIDLGKDHFPSRQRQVKFRSEECIKAVDLLFAMNEGVAPRNILENEPGHENDAQLKMFENCIDTTDFSIMGHSFGGATSLLTLQKDSRVNQGILLDPWMFPIKDETEIYEKLKKPLLFINTQTFHIVSNVNYMEKLLTKEDALERKMYTMLHTTHESQCDSPAVSGYWLNWFMKKLDPITAFRINTYLILRFLNRQIGYPLNNESIEKYLNSESHNIVEGLTKPWV